MSEKPLAAIITLYPTDDSYVWDKEPDTTHGNETHIEVMFLPTTGPPFPEGMAYGYLRFDISKIPTDSRIVGALLYLRQGRRDPYSPDVAVHRCYVDDWSEDWITWDNFQPPYESVADDVKPIALLEYTTLTVFKTVNDCYRAGKRFVSLKLMMPKASDIDAGINAKEAGSWLPKLEIEVEMAPPTHTLSINSSPVSGVPFTIDGLTRTTPFSATMDEGAYTITMPSTVTIGGVQYNFTNWTDGVTTPSHMINLTIDMSLTANYRTVIPTHIVTVRASPEIRVPTTVDGKVIGNTPVSAEVVEGDHVISVPSEVEV